jgi:hypothetical protein
MHHPWPGDSEHRRTVRATVTHIVSSKLNNFKFNKQLLTSKAVIIGLVSTIAVAILATTVGYNTLAHDVIISVDGKTRSVSTFDGTVADVLTDEGVTVSPRDQVVPSLDSAISDGTEISVRFSRPLSVTVDGHKTTYWTTATNVASALGQLGIRYGNATLSTSRDAAIDRQGMILVITTPKLFVLKLGKVGPPGRRHRSHRRRDQVRRVGSASPGLRSEVRRIGLHQDPIDWCQAQSLTQRLRVLEGHRAGEGQVRASLEALCRELRITGEAVHHPTVRRPDLVNNRQHLSVRLAVVDHQGLVELVCQLDMATEGTHLLGPAVGWRPEVIEASLTDRPNSHVGGQIGDFGECLVELALSRQPGRLVGVQRNPGDDRAVLPRCLHSPARAR